MFTFLQVMAREGGHCPITGRADMSIYNSEVEPDILELAHIINQSLSRGVEVGSQKALQKVGPPP